MADAFFSFGQRGNHFFQCPTRREIARLPKKLNHLLNSNKLFQIHHVTLGYGDSFLITWRDTDGADHIESQGLPQELTAFLYAADAQNVLIRNIPALRLTLGPYNSAFFVHDSSSYLWMNLPPDLLNAIKSRIKDGAWLDKPRLVALGCDDNFLLITQRNAAVWDLERYDTLSSMMEFSRAQEHGIEEVRNVTLHAYRYRCFVATNRNGMLLWESVPPHEVAGVEGMREAVARAARVAREFAEREARERERVERERRANEVRRPPVQRHATIRHEWEGRKHEFQAKAKGLRLSLSLNVTAGALGKMLR